MSENLNTTINETQPLSCSSNPTAEKIGKTFAYCLFFFVSFAGNTVIGIIVYKTKTMRKPINFFIANMAMSDLLFPIFVVPPLILRLYTDSWLIGGSLGQVFCKLKAFIPDVSSAVVVVKCRFWRKMCPPHMSLTTPNKTLLALSSSNYF